MLGSRSDQADDLLAEKDRKKISVHILQATGPIGPSAINNLKPSGENFIGFDEVWIVSNSYFDASARALARKNGIRLIEQASPQRDIQF